MLKIHKIPLQKLTSVTNFQARGRDYHLSYRYYPSWSTQTIVLFHGLVSNSIYMSALAHTIAERKIAQVIIPNLRGHGEDKRPLLWKSSSEILQDFEEILIHVKARTSLERMSVLGHSFGCSWLLKLLEHAPASLRFDNSYLLAPYIERSQVRGDWLTDEQDEVRVAWPENLKSGNEITIYPKSFFETFKVNPAAFAKSKFHIIESNEDEILYPVPSHRWNDWKVQSQTRLEEGSHMGLVMDKGCIEKIADLVSST